MSEFMKRVEAAINVLRAGGMVILTDDEHRENEGDLVAAAELVTPDMINFMAQYGRGLICLAMTEARVRQLHLPMMPKSPASKFDTSFTVSIEAATGVKTGISTADRAHTILTAIADQAKPEDVIYPGHVFPLQAKEGGVIVRRGHTEGSVDLMRIAGLKPAAVICEIMNKDGSMSRAEDLKTLAKKHHLPILSIQDLVNYRIKTEILVTEEISARIPMEGYGDFNLVLFKNLFDDHEHFALYKPVPEGKTPLVRVHSECITGDLFGSLKCDCGPQLHQALGEIAQEGGLLIYLRQEGRGIGLMNKLKAYVLQEQGLDTVDANLSLGLPVDKREYSLAFQMLKHFKWQKIRLMTNNPEKVKWLEFFGVEIEARIPIEVAINPENEKYIQIKQQKLGHLFVHNTKQS